MSSYKDDFKRGVTELLVLRFLTDGDKYGYEITKSFEDLSDGEYTMMEGTLYPVLYKLEDAECISSYSVKVGKRRMRKFYHLEQKGRDKYEAMLKDYLILTEKIFKMLGRDNNGKGTE